MKRIIILIGLLFSSTLYPQNNFEEAQNCFNNGDYACAINQYKSEFKNTDYKLQIKAKLKLIEVENIVKQLKKAQDWFDDGDFDYAKATLEKINKINPRDPNVKILINECNQKNAPFLDTSPSDLILSHEKSVKNQIKVKTNSESWKVLKDRTPSWISTTSNSDILLVSCKKNKKKERKGDIYIKSSDNLEYVIRITQKGKR